MAYDCATYEPPRASQHAANLRLLADRLEKNLPLLGGYEQRTWGAPRWLGFIGYKACALGWAARLWSADFGFKRSRFPSAAYFFGSYFPSSASFCLSDGQELTSIDIAVEVFGLTARESNEVFGYAYRPLDSQVALLREYADLVADRERVVLSAL